uniref:Ig-like domain-containing protein n=1 Tax=Denticeps clupeoides TaxID=299321 RepID=A0AAY4DDZ7_9TELE
MKTLVLLPKNSDFMKRQSRFTVTGNFINLKKKNLTVQSNMSFKVQNIQTQVSSCISDVTADFTVDQGERFVSSHLHGSVTLPCSYSLTSVESWVWLKYAPGQGLQPIMSSYYQDVEHRKGTDKSRFSYQKTETTFNLHIDFWRRNSPTIQVQQHYLLDPASEGHNVTLNCTVISGGCAGEHSVYWFRHGAPGSHPGIIYTHGDRSAGCEKNPEAGSSTQSCVYHLPKRNLSTTEAGTYYCAVAACGRIVFGNGTKLEISRSHPGIIYTHGDRSAGCEKNPEAGSSTQSCVYHLPKRNLSTTDAGTYYCAVAACGQIMIGIGTKLDVVALHSNHSNLLLPGRRRHGTIEVNS